MTVSSVPSSSYSPSSGSHSSKDSTSSSSPSGSGKDKVTRLLPQLIPENHSEGYRRPSDRIQSPKGRFKRLKDEERKVEVSRGTFAPSPTLTCSPTEASSVSGLEEEYQRDFLQAEHYFEKSDWTQALKFSNKVLEKYPTFLSALEIRLHIYYRDPKYMMETLADCNRILAINPRHEQALIIRMKVQFEMEFYIGAKKDAQFFLENIGEDNIECIKYIGAICLHENKLESALENLLEAWEVDLDDPFTLLYLARANYQSKDLERALSFTHILLNADPLHIKALLMNATILIDMNLLSKAEAALSKIKVENRNREYNDLRQKIAAIKKKNSKCIIC